MSSLENYAIVSQTAKLVILYSGDNDTWQVTTLETQGDISIPCLRTTLSLEQLYSGVL
jgi:hypothetical protein